jgi:cyclopropane fatty-acyl-phospholipid synthase-like methyltransferase
MKRIVVVGSGIAGLGAAWTLRDAAEVVVLEAGSQVGDPPHLIRSLADSVGLRTVEVVDFGPSYAKTLAAWLDRFDAAWPDIARLGFDERFRRMWRYYLAYCEAGFNTGRISVQQWAFERGT